MISEIRRTFAVAVVISLTVASGVAQAGILVTPENYAEAEVDLSAATIIPQIGSNKFRHDRSLMPLDKQPAVTMNRDTVYSFGMFYTPKGTTITLPRSKDDRYQSAMMMQTDHYVDQVFYAPGTFTIVSQTEFTAIVIRTQVDATDPADIRYVNCLQDQIAVKLPAGVKPKDYVLRDWEMPSLLALRTKYQEEAKALPNLNKTSFSLFITAFRCLTSAGLLGGFDWGGRTANIVAALWPERCKALVAVSGYTISSREAQKTPLPPQTELRWWYLYYFATERGREGYDKYRRDFWKLTWQLASPKWNFDDATFDRSVASAENPDHVAIVIDSYRWRISLARGEAKYDDLEKRLAQFPVITVPTVTMEGDANGALYPAPDTYAKKYVGKYEHRTITGGIGHNLPQEAPLAFAQAIVHVVEV